MPLRIDFTLEAERDFGDLIDFVAVDNPSAAAGMAAKVEKSLRLLSERPFLGRIALETGRPMMRRLSVAPFVIFYLVERDTLHVIRILHGARFLDDPKLFKA